MSGLNGTGPMGKGPMTGGARGMCKPRDNSKKAMAAGSSLGRNRVHGHCRRNMFQDTRCRGWDRFKTKES